MSRIWIVDATQVSAYLPDHSFDNVDLSAGLCYGLHPSWLTDFHSIQKQHPTLDPSIQLALLASKQIPLDHFREKNLRWGCNIGSARGTTQTWEERYQHYLSHQCVPPDTSPLTTAGSIGTKVLASLSIAPESIAFDHSATCNSSAVALANGYAWLKAGMCDLFLVGGAEMPLTPFTLAQMQALRIYSNQVEFPYCKPFNQKRENTFVLGSGAGLLLLKNEAQAPNAEAIEIEAIGFASEIPPSLTGISTDAKHIQSALRSAIGQLPDNDNRVDLIIPHAPGTAKGDHAEYQAYRGVFDELPFIFPTKHLTGHTFGASTAINIAIAKDMYAGRFPIYPTYDLCFDRKEFPKKIRRIAVISAGFGGMAMAIILKK